MTSEPSQPSNSSVLLDIHNVDRNNTTPSPAAFLSSSQITISDTLHVSPKPRTVTPPPKDSIDSSGDESTPLEGDSTLLQEEVKGMDQEESKNGETNESHTNDTSEIPQPRSSSRSEEKIQVEGSASPIADQTQDALGSSNDKGVTWDPLRGPEQSSYQEEKTMAVEDTDIVDSNGRLLFPEDNANPSPSVSRRVSNLRLDVKPSSPQTWEVVNSHDRNKPGATEVHSTAGSHKFQTNYTRPLIPKSSYYFGPPSSDSAYGTPPVGQIGVHHPREILRVERDYTGGEIIQFAPIYPLELEGRITPTQFLESINSINELLISAHSLRHSFFDNMIAIFSLQLSKLFVTPHYQKEMKRLEQLIDNLNTEFYNPVGLNILWPQNVAFLFLEIEYY